MLLEDIEREGQPLVEELGVDTCHDRAPLVGFVVGHYRNVAVVLATVEHGIVVTGYGDTRDVALDGRREVTAVDAVLQREGSGDLAGDAAHVEEVVVGHRGAGHVTRVYTVFDQGRRRHLSAMPIRPPTDAVDAAMSASLRQLVILSV